MYLGENLKLKMGKTKKLKNAKDNMENIKGEK